MRRIPKKRTLADRYRFRKTFARLCEQQRIQNILIATFDILMRNEISKYQATPDQQ